MDSVQRRFISTPLLCGVAVWVASVIILYAGDRQWAILAVSTFGYAALLFGITVWTLPSSSDDSSDGLRAPPPGRATLPRYAVALLTVVWVFAYGFVFSGFHVPIAAPWVRLVEPIQFGSRWLSGLTFQNFLTFAVIPGALLLALGARPRELGLSRSARGTWRAIVLSWVLPLTFIAVAFARGRLSGSLLGLMLLHNLLSNGFTEEFFARGIVFSHLRGLQRTDWAMVTQGLIFALLHFGGTVADEHGNAVLAIANVIGMNFPMGVALGVMALRSGSLLLPSAVHVSLDTMKDLVGL